MKRKLLRDHNGKKAGQMLDIESEAQANYLQRVGVIVGEKVEVEPEAKTEPEPTAKKKEAAPAKEKKAQTKPAAKKKA